MVGLFNLAFLRRAPSTSPMISPMGETPTRASTGARDESRNTFPGRGQFSASTGSQHWSERLPEAGAVVGTHSGGWARQGVLARYASMNQDVAAPSPQRISARRGGGEVQAFLIGNGAKSGQGPVPMGNRGPSSAGAARQGYLDRLSPFGNGNVKGARTAFNKLVATLVWLPEDSRSGFLSKRAGDSDGARLKEDIQRLKDIGKAVGSQKLKALSKIVNDLDAVRANLKSVREKLTQSPQDSKLLRAEMKLQREERSLKVRGMETKAELTILRLHLRTLNFLHEGLTVDPAGRTGRRS